MRRALAILALALALPASAWGTTRQALPNGLHVLVQPDPATEVVAAELLLRVGSGDEAADQAGVRFVTQSLLLRGSAHESGEAMGDRLAEAGGSIDVSVGLDYVEMHVVAPAEGFETALDIMAEAVCDPAFLPEEFERERQNALDALRAEQEDPFQAAYLALREGLYGDGPYGRSTIGDAGALRRLTRDDVLAFYRRCYGPRNAVLSIVGGVDEVRAARAVKRAFGGWKSEARPTRGPCTAPPLAHSGVVVREVPANQAYLVLGFPAPAVDGKGYYALQVIDSLLSGGSDGRLSHALREQAWLAYQIASFYPTLAGSSHFGIYVAADPRHLDRVKAIILQELNRLRDEPVGPNELARAKRYLLGSYAMGRQEAQARAYGSAWYELLGLPPDFERHYRESVAAVTAEQVQDSARALIHHFVAALALPRG